MSSGGANDVRMGVRPVAVTDVPGGVSKTSPEKRGVEFQRVLEGATGEEVRTSFTGLSRITQQPAGLSGPQRARIFQNIVSTVINPSHPYAGIDPKILEGMRQGIVEALVNSHYLKPKKQGSSSPLV